MYELVFVAFQATFAAITGCLILGSIVERVKFKAVLLFLTLWFTFAYCPIAHMVWFWAGPDAYTSAEAVAAANATAGLLWQWGALDFAGGTVVHINAGVAGLDRRLRARQAHRPRPRVDGAAPPDDDHDRRVAPVVRLVRVQCGLRARSERRRGARIRQHIPGDRLRRARVDVRGMARQGKPSMLGAASGAVSGLVAITPAAGNVGIPGAFVIGIAAGLVCFWGVTGLKRLIRADDSLDVFGIHAVGGILGALLTGIFNSPDLGGPGLVTDWVTVTVGYPGIGAQLLIQAKAVGFVVAWSAIVSLAAFGIVKLVMGLRVSEEDEREGLDITTHGERALEV